MFAKYYDAMTARYEEYITVRKGELFAGIGGTIVEIGPGTGANLRYVPEGARWIGVEPNPHMHDQLRARAEREGVEADVRLAGAGGIEVDDAAADAAVSTLVLCSVPDVAQVLGEIRRVLKPGGELRFIEHVAAPRGTGLRRAQSLLKPLWYMLGDGCRIDRDIGPAIESAGFSSVDIDAFRVPKPFAPPWVSPHIAGTARR
jgi:ubiquinone/menaquinone biosynthesis C-methylase UbiE